MQFMVRDETVGSLMHAKSLMRHVVVVCLLCNLLYVVAVAMLSMSTANSYFYAAVVTIIAVHIFLALFIYSALNDKPPTHKAD